VRDIRPGKAGRARQPSRVAAALVARPSGKQLAQQQSDAAKARFKSDIAKRTATISRIGPDRGFVGRFTGDLINAAVYSPAGAYQIGKAGYHDIGDTIHGKPTLKRTGQIGKTMARGVASDFRHPLRHPGYTALDLSAALGAGEGLAARGLARSFKRPLTGTVERSVGEMTVKSPASKRAGVAAIQKRIAKNASPKKVGKSLVQERRLTEAIERAPAEALAHRSRKLTTPMQTALRVVNEGKPIGERIKFHEKQLETATGQAVRNHRQKILLLKAADRYVEGTNLKSVAAATSRRERRQLMRLHETQGNLERVSATREKRLAELGRLEKHSVEARVQTPGAIISGADTVRTRGGRLMERVPGQENYYKLEREHRQASTVLKGEQRKLTTLEARLRKPPKNGKARARPSLQAKVESQRLTVARWQGEVKTAAKKRDELGPQLKPVTGGRARIPYVSEEAPRSHGAPAGYRGGRPRAPASLTHEFTGGLLKQGNFRDRTAQLVAESGIEAQRFSSVFRLRDRIVKAAHDIPEEDDIPIRLESLKNKPFPAGVKEAMRKNEEGIKLSRQEKELLHTEAESVRDLIFPKDIERVQTKGVRWVHPDVLGGLDKQPLRLASGVGRKPVAAVDAINNASKMAILYLKPAYAIPNIAGNVAMNIVQQGPKAMTNWWQSSSRILERRLGPDATATIDSVMGEGVAGSISSHEGLGQKAVQGAAGQWSKIVDRVFRRAAFLHEAKRLGYKTPQQLRALLTDTGHRDKLIEAGQRAKDAIIDYDHLSDVEREAVRRLIFFYPWVKGSTRYAGHFLTEHPIQSAATAQTGRYGKEHTGLGPTPSYLEGAFRVGKHKLVNPSAAAVFQTPAQLAQIAQGLKSGGVTEASRASNLLTPAISLAIALGARQDAFGNAIPPRESGLDIAKQSLLESTPQYTLYKRLTGDNSKKMFPLSPKEAIGQFTVGGIAPKTYNPKVLRAQAEKEQSSLMTPAQRVTVKYTTFKDDLKTAMKKAGEPKIPREVANLLNLRHERAASRVAAAGGHKLDSKIAFGSDIDLIVKHGWMNAGEAKAAKAWATKAGSTDMATASRYLTTHYFDRDKLLSASIKYLRDNGHPNLKLPTLP
jgi:hypothetical protein